eukprot:15071408-Alexandrium_andersonii.AAC.1
MFELRSPAWQTKKCTQPSPRTCSRPSDRESGRNPNDASATRATPRTNRHARIRHETARAKCSC